MMAGSITRCLQHLSISPNIIGSTAGLHTSCERLHRLGIVFKHRPSFKWAVKQAGLDIPYTHEPLPKLRTGGRGPFGRVWLKHISGGLNIPEFRVDPVRDGEPNPDAKPNSDPAAAYLPIEERVLCLHKNFWRRHLMALVARGDRKRWIIAGAGMKVGDLTVSHPRFVIPQVPVANPNPGDAYPIGAIPEGSIVSCVEEKPGGGARYAVEGGTSATYVRALPDGKALLVVPSKQEIIVSQHCTVMLGQVSGSAREKFKSFNEKRRLGIKQRSGFRQKKGDRFGRRLRNYVARFDCTAEYPVNYDIRTWIYTWPGETKWRKPMPRVVADYSDNPRFRWNEEFIKNRIQAST